MRILFKIKRRKNQIKFPSKKYCNSRELWEILITHNLKKSNQIATKSQSFLFLSKVPVFFTFLNCKCSLPPQSIGFSIFSKKPNSEPSTKKISSTVDFLGRCLFLNNLILKSYIQGPVFLVQIITKTYSIHKFYENFIPYVNVFNNSWHSHQFQLYENFLVLFSS